MKKVYLIGALLSFGLLAEAQSFMRFEDKAFNFGAKVGFNATFPSHKLPFHQWEGSGEYRHRI